MEKEFETLDIAEEVVKAMDWLHIVSAVELDPTKKQEMEKMMLLFIGVLAGLKLSYGENEVVFTKTRWVDSTKRIVADAFEIQNWINEIRRSKQK